MKGEDYNNYLKGIILKQDNCEGFEKIIDKIPSMSYNIVIASGLLIVPKP